MGKSIQKKNFNCNICGKLLYNDNRNICIACEKRINEAKVKEKMLNDVLSYLFHIGQTGVAVFVDNEFSHIRDEAQGVFKEVHNNERTELENKGRDLGIKDEE